MEWSDLKEHHVYSSGNHEGLEKFISAHTGSPNPKVLLTAYLSLFLNNFQPKY